jgi:hypothetical protein
MNPGEFLTRSTVWIALLAYAIGAGLLLSAAGREAWTVRARLFWTIGCVFFLAHVFSAFEFYHHWSHADAYRETARQTREMTGLNWGGGIFLNYVLALAWFADVFWWWVAPGSFARRPKWLTVPWQSFFAFMVFNGTIVFGHGPVRWLGVVIFAGLGWLWWRSRRA